MCQLNLDAYQEQVNKQFDTAYHIPVLYFTQLIGLALDIPLHQLGFGREFVNAAPALVKIGTEPLRKEKRQRPSKQALPMP
jgi:heterodisulfide reductase subunit B